ncbi:hypothetical protein FHS43_001114 [Streptosporangium becharense]|uniref:Uncharacterized protein n=1 Tax=Streptosporangium becharense TaxID=1816182 RepID=A0A7W9MFL1_9ACTN|nr:hypothetical protein [Streptosporangium becharense]MBB2909868.1 hypothetical protein [Streptosporangium becharense]MBB5819177.1 hypothetical protein [Streptosporangium becharense]
MIYFGCRTHHQGPLGERALRLPDATVLGWFRRGWSAVVDDVLSDAAAWVEAELGGDGAGLVPFFERVREHRVPAPESWEGLRDVLREHLPAGAEPRVDAHSVRVHSAGAEAEPPLLFFADVFAAADLDRVARPLYGERRPSGSVLTVPRPAGEAVRVWPLPVAGVPLSSGAAGAPARRGGGVAVGGRP